MSFDKQNSEGENGQRDRGAEGLFPLFPSSPLLRRIFCLLFLSFAGLSAGPAEEAPLSEYQVKSALLLNFVRYSDWPATAFANPDSPYVVGIAGRDPFGKDLEKAFERKTVKGRPFVLKRVSGEQEMRACHLLFVSSSERRRSRELLEKISGAPVLTVGDFPDFLDHGGVINFLIKDGSVRFEINLEPARGTGIKLDANLLKVAASVRGKHE
jgi:hypothetical protein